jgi:hypothetical protein
LPIAADSGSPTAYQTAITTDPVYGSLMSVSPDTSTTAADFDQVFLFPLKSQKPKMKGGIFFNTAAITNGTNTLYGFTTLVNTRSPTSPFFLTNVASQAYLKTLGNTVSITVTLHALPRTYQQLQLNNTISGFLASFIFSLALAFKFASIISFIVK